MKYPHCFFSLSVVIALAVVTSTRAELYEVVASGKIHFIDGTVWDSSVVSGGEMTARFVFDTSVDNPPYYRYDFYGLPSSVDFGDYHFESTSHSDLFIYSYSYLVGNGYGMDAYDFKNFPAPFSNYLSVSLFGLSAFSYNPNDPVKFPGDQPVRVFPATQFQFPQISVGGRLDPFDLSTSQSIGADLISYTVNPISAAKVPDEWGNALAVGGCFLLLAFICRFQLETKPIRLLRRFS